MATLKKRDANPIGVLMFVFGGFSLAAAMIGLGAVFLVDRELLRAFALAFFFLGLIGAIILFGVAKIIFLLNDLRSPNAG